MGPIKLLCFFFALQAAPAAAQDAASLQFSVAAPDPVMAGEQVILQTLVVNTGAQAWTKGSYYWTGEIYTLEGEERKFLAQTDSVTPPEDVAPGAAHGVQIPFTVPENMRGRRLLYRVFLVKDGKRILETDYKGFQVIEKEFRPPAPQDFKVGGDVTFSYKNTSEDGWSGSQGVTAANLVGKIKDSSFLFNTYIIHTYHKPITPTIVLLNYYAPWGNLSVGDVSPVLTPLSMDGQGMRGVSYERSSGKLSFIGLVGRIVAPQEADSNTSGRYARYTSGFKAAWQLTPALKVAADAVLSRDDEHSIVVSSDSATLTPKQNMLYGVNAEWKLSRKLTFDSDLQFSGYKADMREQASVSGRAWKQELKYRGSLLTLRGAVSRIDPEFYSFASPSVVSDRQVLDGEVGIFPADWDTITLAYNGYDDNLDSNPSKTTTHQAQTTVGNTLRVAGKTTVNTTLTTNTTKAKPAGVTDNQTTTLNFSVTQPWAAHTLSVSVQQTSFKDNTRLSDDLDTALLSLSGAFKLTRRLSASLGMVDSSTKDKAAGTTAKNSSLTANFSYSIPRRSMAVQFWTTMSSARNDSLTAPVDSGSLALNAELVWARDKASRWTIGAGVTSKTDRVAPANEGSVLSVLTRYNYSF